MTVQELIEKLSKLNPDSKVVVQYVDKSTGCDSCGYGSDTIERDFSVYDLESRVIIQAE